MTNNQQKPAQRPMEWTFDEICDSRDFNHDEVFVLKSAYDRAVKLANLLDDYTVHTQRCFSNRKSLNECLCGLNNLRETLYAYGKELNRCSDEKLQMISEIQRLREAIQKASDAWCIKPICECYLCKALAKGDTGE